MHAPVIWKGGSEPNVPNRPRKSRAANFRIRVQSLFDRPSAAEDGSETDTWPETGPQTTNFRCRGSESTFLTFGPLRRKFETQRQFIAFRTRTLIRLQCGWFRMATKCFNDQHQTNRPITAASEISNSLVRPPSFDQEPIAIRPSSPTSNSVGIRPAVLECAKSVLGGKSIAAAGRQRSSSPVWFD